jgi:LysM repeat protein
MSQYFFSVKKHLSFLFFFASIVAIEAQSSARWEYIQRYKQIAVEEMQRSGVPASIKLAQGLLESGAGTSSLAKQANNHFGMKCGAEWRGETFYLKDDDYDENGVLKESCFRVFKSPEESYKAHSEFLRDPNKAYRYGFLFRIPVTDYKKWAQGLKQAGYATSPTYDNALISIIEQYKLNDIGTNVDASLSDVILVNDVKMTVAKAGQTPAELAQTYKVKLKCLMKYNEGIKGANQPLAVNDRIFLQKKRRFFRGSQKTHYVKPGESMYTISQQYGIRLKSLLRKNKMSEGTEAAFGEKLHLRGWPFFGRKSPKLRENIGKEAPTNPFDEGTGKVPHIDETNQVDPNDLPTQGNNNGNSNNGSSNSNTNSGNNGTGNNNTNGTNNGGNNGNGTTNNSSGNSSSNNSNNNGNGTVTPANPTNNGGNNTGSNNNTSNPTTKPTTTTGGSTTKPTTTTGGSSTTGKPSIPPTTKPTTTTGGSSTTTKPSSTTGGTKPTTTTGSGNGSTTTGNTTTKPSIPTTIEEPRPTGIQYHTVDKGETLYSIAKRYGMTVDGLKKLNDLPDNNIKLGQKIRLN